MDRWIRYLLIAALLYGVGLRFYAIGHWKQGLSHDESVSYLCASATEGAYQSRMTGLMDIPITVGEIQAFYARPEGIHLATVSSDLAEYDIHPPLYFWGLHMHHALVGSGITGGMWLNFAAGLLILIFTYALAKRCLCSTNLALAACAILYLSPAVAQIDLEARQYQFMALCAMASYLLTQRRLLGISDLGELVLFTLVNAFGLLSHYYYAFVLVPGLFLIWRQHRWSVPTWTYVASLLGSLLLFLLFFPEFLDFVASYAARPKEAKEAASLIDRIKTILYASLAFFAEAHGLRYAFLGLGALALAVLAVKLKKVREFISSLFESPMLQVVVTLIWCAGFTALLYLVGISPAHAVGEQYFAYFWPLLAIMLVHLAGRVFTTRYRAWILTVYMLQLGYSFTTSVSGSEYLQPVLPEIWNARAGGSDLIVVDDVKRSFLPRAMRDLPEATPLFLMNKEHPALDGRSSVSFIHLAIEGRPAAAEFTTWMADQGFSHGVVLEHEHHELHTYTR